MCPSDRAFDIFNCLTIFEAPKGLVIIRIIYIQCERRVFLLFIFKPRNSLLLSTYVVFQVWILEMLVNESYN